jgi:hypothetical protein
MFLLELLHLSCQVEHKIFAFSKTVAVVLHVLAFNRLLNKNAIIASFLCLTYIFQAKITPCLWKIKENINKENPPKAAVIVFPASCGAQIIN